MNLLNFLLTFSMVAAHTDSIRIPWDVMRIWIRNAGFIIDWLALFRDCKPEMQMMYAGSKLALVEQVWVTFQQKSFTDDLLK